MRSSPATACRRNIILQFADHYFRVLGESQARYNDQRPQRDRDFDDDGDEEMLDAGEDQQSDGDGRDDEDRAPPRRESRDRDDRGNRATRNDRDERSDRGDRNTRRRFNREDGDGDGDDRRPRANGVEEVEPVGIPLDVLPPAIGRDEASNAEEAIEEIRPRRRARRPRVEDNDGDIAPAA